MAFVLAALICCRAVQESCSYPVTPLDCSLEFFPFTAGPDLFPGIPGTRAPLFGVAVGCAIADPAARSRPRCPGSARLTHLCLPDFRDGYHTGRGLLDHLNSDSLDCRSERPRGLFRWRPFRLSLGDRSLRGRLSLRSLRKLLGLWACFRPFSLFDL
jgi:hypothetical protein